tara:strand:- start:649 stop:1209 length:561 start_codon:yes stop_codon:yes gene_type:complete
MKLFRKKNKRTIEEQNLHNKKIWEKEQESEEKLTNPDFSKREFNLDDEFEKVIQVTYEEGQEVEVKLFLSSNEWSTFSRNYKEKVDDNFIRLLIDISQKTGASLISGGNYSFNDDFEKGYSLFVLFRYADKKLLSIVSEILRNHGFGCLPTQYSIHAHLNDEHPIEEKAKEILSQITDEISKSVKQ